MKHHFRPLKFHTSLGAHEPVLTVRDGESIVTTTADSWGFDHNEDQVAPWGNPQTGPFFVEHAAPGDTLAVRFDSVCPNRSYGYCDTIIERHLVTPDYADALAEQGTAEWRIERMAGTATLVSPTIRRGLLSLPLAPFLGCFGVAPAGEPISTATCGEHGGNMDYRRFVSGTTAYLPVFRPGALLFLGDGHALQGDGEIVGSGVECSMDVTVTVRLLKGSPLISPRGESEDWVFTLGNARPLEAAIRIATTGMLRYLEQEMGFGTADAGLVLAQCARYDLGNLVNPASTVACRIAKARLRALVSLTP
jgi:amidase